MPLPEHLQLNRKQRNDSLVAEFQLSLKELGEGRTRKWAPRGLIIPSFIHLTHLPVPTMRGGGHADTHPICPLAGEKSWGGFSFLFTHGEWGRLVGCAQSPDHVPPPNTQRQDGLSVSTTNWASLTAVSLRARCTAQFQMWGEEASGEGLGQSQPPRGELGIAIIKPQEFEFGNYKTPGSSCPCSVSQTQHGGRHHCLLRRLKLKLRDVK